MNDFNRSLFQNLDFNQIQVETWKKTWRSNPTIALQSPCNRLAIVPLDKFWNVLNPTSFSGAWGLLKKSSRIRTCQSRRGLQQGMISVILDAFPKKPCSTLPIQDLKNVQNPLTKTWWTWWTPSGWASQESSRRVVCAACDKSLTFAHVKSKKHQLCLENIAEAGSNKVLRVNLEILYRK